MRPFPLLLDRFRKVPRRRIACRRRSARERGFALLAVLWSVTVLGLIANHIDLAARSERFLARNVTEQAEARSLADAGLNRGLLVLLTPAARPLWPADGMPRRLDIDGASVTVTIEDEGGKIDVNCASRGLLRTAFAGAGFPMPQANQLAAAIVQWRDSDDPSSPPPVETASATLCRSGAARHFVSIEQFVEAMALDGSTADVARLLTVYSRRSEIDLATASPAVLRCLYAGDEGTIMRILAQRREEAQRAAQRGLASSFTNTFTIQAAGHAGDTVFVRRVIVSLTDEAAPSLRKIRWDEGAAPEFFAASGP